MHKKTANGRKKNEECKSVITSGSNCNVVIVLAELLDSSTATSPLAGSAKKEKIKELTIFGLFGNSSYLPQAVIVTTQPAAMTFIETAVALVVVPVSATTNDIFLLEKQQSAGGNIGS